MASFSFGAGNLRRIASLPLYALGRLATLVIRRDDSWAVSSASGVADGPLSLARIAAADGTTVVWLASTDAHIAAARAEGFQAVRRGSIRGFLATARARVVVVSHGLGDVNRYGVPGAFIVQLWHGIPLKRIGLDSAETTRVPLVGHLAPVRWFMRAMYRRAQSRIRVLPAASHLVRGRLESAFGLDDSRIVVTGEPRVDVLSAGSQAERQQAARSLITSLVGEVSSRVVLYAPTWRDGAEDPAVPSAQEWQEIVDTLTAHDLTLLVRSHPLGGGAYTPPVATDRVRMLASTLLPDVTVALAGVDVLITDYSSLLYDVGLLNMPVLYFAPDADSYAATRGFYGRYQDIAHDIAPTWTRAMAQLAELATDEDAYAQSAARSRALSDRVHAFRDGANTERVYREILRRLPASPQEGTR